MPDQGIVKYLVKLKFEVEGIVERPDLIGAIFGQTEGLFGPEMNLQELQKTWKVGRVEISLESKHNKSVGHVLVPMSTDINTAALTAAAVESVEKVGPYSAKFQLVNIEDVRAIKRKFIVERAKNIVRDWSSKTASEGEEVLKDVTDSTRRAKVINFGKEELPAGPGVYTSDTIYLVEGRADVINLLRVGIENVVALDGASVPDSIQRLSKEKKLTAFLDGDRGGDLILKELSQVAKLDRIIRAPPGREVEDLTPVEILELLRSEPAVKPHYRSQTKQEPTVNLPEVFANKVRELYPQINGTLEAVILDDGGNQLQKIPVSELVQKLEGEPSAKYVVFDGIITQRLVELSGKVGVSVLVGHRTGEITHRNNGVSLNTFRDLGLE